MDIQITYTAQYGLEWRIVLPDHPVARHTDIVNEFWLPEGLSDDCPTQESHPLPDLTPRVYLGPTKKR